MNRRTFLAGLGAAAMGAAAMGAVARWAPLVSLPEEPRVPTLFELAQKHDPDGPAVAIARLLSQPNEILQDLVMKS